MKKIILIAALLVGTFAQAQIKLNKQGGQIMNGDVFTYTELFDLLTNPEGGKLGFNVSNDTEETVQLKMRVDAITNNTAGENIGDDLQLCFGDCVTNITEGGTYPTDNIIIAAGGSTLEVTNQDHFANGNPGNGTDPVIYTISLVTVDEEGAVTGVVVSFTYRYEPTAGLTDLEGLKNMGLVINNTVVKNGLDITATQNANVEIIDLNGKTVKKAAIANGSQSVDLSGLSAAVYIARFATEDNKVSYIRIVKN